MAEATLHDAFLDTRRTTELICSHLETDDYCAQSMPDASPVKWHLGHTSWFFERFVLMPAGLTTSKESPYDRIFNSYYESIGDRIARDRRGTLTRPDVKEVYAYRKQITEIVSRSFESLPHSRIELGIHHEQQHQELILTDLKHLFGTHPLTPTLHPEHWDARWDELLPKLQGTLDWLETRGGLYEIGAPASDREFAFDHEKPRHSVYVPGFALGSRPINNAEYLEFIYADGYYRPELWLSDGWHRVQTEGWNAPLYWDLESGAPRVFTLGGWVPLGPFEPVRHLSYFEADAYARWRGMRLPTEAEWEVARILHPASPEFPAFNDGIVWEWTQSAFAPFPDFQPLKDSWGEELGEYNGKFMSGLMVLRGGSLASPRGHLRPTYRNFFAPDARWQFSGIRLARSLK